MLSGALLVFLVYNILLLYSSGGKKTTVLFYSLSLSLIYFILLVDHHFFLIRISLLQSIQFDQIVWSDEFVLLFVCRLSNIGLKKEFLDLQFLSTA